MNDPLGTDTQGKPVYLRELWPTQHEIQETIASVRSCARCFTKTIQEVFPGDERWNSLAVPEGDLSTGIRTPRTSGIHHTLSSFRTGARHRWAELRVLASWPFSVTASRPTTSRRLAQSRSKALPGGTSPSTASAPGFNSYGSRRGNHEVMVRGTFANIRLRNRLAPGTEGRASPDSCPTARSRPSSTPPSATARKVFP